MKHVEIKVSPAMFTTLVDDLDRDAGIEALLYGHPMWVRSRTDGRLTVSLPKPVYKRLESNLAKFDVECHYN